MTKKLTPRRIVGFLIMIVSALFLIWLLWPRSFAQTLPGFGREPLQQIHGYLFTTDDRESRSISFNPGSPEAETLLDLLQSTRYQRILTLKDWRTITLEYEIHLTFTLGEEENRSIQCFSITGDPFIDVHGSSTFNRTYSAYGGEEFQQNLLDFLLTQDYTAVPEG